MADGLTQQQYLTLFIDRMMNGVCDGIDGLTDDELHFRAHENCNSIGFEAWHVFRTADNIVHFVFEREQPVWLQQGLHEQWELPKVAQGTSMDPADAHALRFPSSAALAQYGRDVLAAVVPRVEAMDDDYLAVVQTVTPWGDITRLEAIGQTLISHGNAHLGQIDIARTIVGKQGLGF
jgi:hypothetical protein